jgi:sec-independent protein translocase protein TatB
MVILVVALVFVGPERLPKLAADIARMIREIRKYTSGLAEEFNEVVKDFEKDTEGERTVWKEIGSGLSGATKSMTEAVRGARADAQGAPDSVAAPAAISTAIAPVSVDARATSAPPIPGATDSGPTLEQGIGELQPDTSDAPHDAPPALTPAPGHFCMECGSSCAAGQKFCSECGAAIMAIV